MCSASVASAPVGSARFGKVLTAMVTPLTPEGELDLPGTAELARWLVTHGSDGLVLTGTTGEAPTLRDDEAVAVWEAVRAAVDVPLLAGTGKNDTRHTIELSERAVEAGVDGLLVVSPYYNRPPQRGLEAHYRAVAAAVDAPIVIYDVPSRTARPVAAEVIVRLAHDVPNIVGLKDARGDLAESAWIAREVPSGFAHYSGDDVATLPLLSVGAVGVIGVATHWAGVLVSEMIAAFEKGEVAMAREINARLLESYAAEPVETQTSAAKAALTALGKPAGPCRLPLPPVSDELQSRMSDIVAALDVAP
jgi:4-hydroxy-tetrahydrodipicolinate synthase